MRNLGYALQNPKGHIYPWTVTDNVGSAKRHVKRWRKTWKKASEQGYRIVEVEIVRIRTVE